MLHIPISVHGAYPADSVMRAQVGKIGDASGQHRGCHRCRYQVRHLPLHKLMGFAEKTAVRTLLRKLQLLHQSRGNTAAVPVNIINNHAPSAGPFIQLLPAGQSFFLHCGKDILICHNYFLLRMCATVGAYFLFHPCHAVRRNPFRGYLTDIKTGGRQDHCIKQMDMGIRQRRKHMHSLKADILVIALFRFRAAVSQIAYPVPVRSHGRKGFFHMQTHGMHRTAVIKYLHSKSSPHFPQPLKNRPA